MKMGYKRIIPSSERSKIDFTKLQEGFIPAREAIDQYKKISLTDMGIDWNSCILGNGRSKIISFSVGAEYKSNYDSISGIIKDFGREEYKLFVTGGSGNLGSSGFTEGYIIASVSEAVDIASKLEIITDNILPPGEMPAVFGDGNSTGGGISNPDVASYRAFAAELLSGARSIIVSKPNEDFGDYIVAQTNQGWFIAYNRSYGEGLYIVPDLDTLMLDKQTIRREGSAIRIRRDRRGNRWKDRIRDYM